MKTFTLLIFFLFLGCSDFGQRKYECKINSTDITKCIEDGDLLEDFDSTTIDMFSDFPSLLIPSDTICFCQGYEAALIDSETNFLIIGDPMHVSQYIYHKYAEKGIKLIMTGDIVGFGQRKFNDGYNSITIEKIKESHPHWNYYKPFKKQYRKKGLNDFEIERKLEKLISSSIINDSLNIRLKRIPYYWNFKNSNITITVWYKKFKDLSINLKDLKKGISISISELDEKEIKDLQLAIDLSEFNHPNYNWLLNPKRNKVYVEINNFTQKEL